jgi:asparagine synthase (glutamine-hydrolysing)
MCGIVGMWNKAGAVDTVMFDQMVDSLSNRGPDGRGTMFLEKGRVALGHRRLSIIDLSDAGSQPMANETGTLWLTFNGEIYNFLSLRRELEHRGYRFRSHTDSEVIIHAYDEWGTDCVHRFRGIFAFAIYDCRRRELFLARDHVGVKPLYYAYSQEAFIFASLPKAILRADGFRAEIDPEAFALYLAFGNVPADKSIFQGIKKLLPGHRLIVRDWRVEIASYWTVRYSPSITNREEAEEVVAEKVRDCVVAQAISDVPIGTLLSGGVDSTILTGILASTSGHAGLGTFTVGFEEEESDERGFARLIADFYRTNHHDDLLSYETAVALLPEIVEAFDEPFHLNGLFPMYAVSRLVQKNQRKVVLGGDGGDELFAGYRWYDTFNASLKGQQCGVAGLGGWLRMLFRYPPAQQDPVSVFFRYNGFLNNVDQRVWAGRALEPVSANLDVLWPLRRHWHPEYSPVLAAQWLDFHCFLVDHCLCKVDRASMACGVEARVPLLDPELVTLMFSIDHRITLFEGERKALFKRALRDFLPAGMDTQRKKGFSSPINTWLQQGLAESSEPFLLDGSLCAKGYLNPDTIESAYPNAGAGMQLLLLGAELWARRWLEGDHDAIAKFVVDATQNAPSSIDPT